MNEVLTIDELIIKLLIIRQNEGNLPIWTDADDVWEAHSIECRAGKVFIG